MKNVEQDKCDPSIQGTPNLVIVWITMFDERMSRLATIQSLFHVFLIPWCLSLGWVAKINLSNFALLHFGSGDAS